MIPPVPETPGGIAVVGGGPAGLMAAEVARDAGIEVDLFESQGSVGRKFLLAGKGGLNLTHAEHFAPFVARYGAAASTVRGWLQSFDNLALRSWARDLGVETMVGSSGRVFPIDLKAAPLLRSWVRRLRARGVRMHMHHRWLGLGGGGELRLHDGQREIHVKPAATILALGGGSWPQLGSDGAWVPALQECHIDVAPLQPSNCGFEVDWSAVFIARFEGAPLKTIVASSRSIDGNSWVSSQAEFIITRSGVEGGAVYALSAALRESILRDGTAELRLDLAPGTDLTQLEAALSRPRNGRSLTEHLRRTVGIRDVKAALLYECAPRDALRSPALLAALIKSLPLRLSRPRPLAEAISTAGGVRFNELDELLMLRRRPGVFCAGEMLDWEAPTGGYLLTACLASGRVAASGAIAWQRLHGRAAELPGTPRFSA